MRIIYFSILLFFGSPGDPASDAMTQLDLLSQHLTGSWHSADGHVEEHWIAAKGGLMLGLNRNASRPGTPFFEFMRIEKRDEGLYYAAQPKGTAGAAFKLTHLDDEKAVFENHHHDFPQVITYFWKGKDQLCAAIGTLEKREQMSWCWQRGSLATP